MQISDLVGQYFGNNAPSGLKQTPAGGNVVSTLKEMKSGKIFEGTVNSVKGSTVVLGLSNGQTITARLDTKLNLSQGQALYFQVKSNDGNQIAIKPYTMDGSQVNLTLVEALKAAGLPVEERNLSMVNSMMEQQMSIDRSSLNEMARAVGANPDTDVNTIVQMKNLNLPLTTEFISQFENYANDKQAIQTTVEDYIQQLPEVFSQEDLSTADLQTMGSKVLSLATEGLSEELEIPTWLQENATGLGGESIPQEGMQPLAQTEETQAGEVVQVDTPTQETALPELEQTEAEVTGEKLLTEEGNSQTNQAGEIQAGQETNNGITQSLEGNRQYVPGSLGAILTKDQMADLTQQLVDLYPEDTDAQNLPKPLTPQDSAVAVLNRVQSLLEGTGGNEDANLKTKLQNLLSGEPLQKLLAEALEQQWTIKPQDLKDGDQISRLFEKMKGQLDRLNEIVKASGQEAENLQTLSQDIKSNVDFMDQINQIYNYVQIPLKMSGQNANGELYVYTNRKALAEGEKDLTAFLHLDMEHLGPTDVSIRMHQKEVYTKFYFEDDATYDLVEAHAPELAARLKDKGYNCNIEVINDGNSVNFVEDFLKKDQPSAGLVHRYSFDMRA